MNLSVKFEVELLPIEKGKRTCEIYYVVAELSTGTIGIGEAVVLAADNRDHRLRIAKHRAIVYALQNCTDGLANQLLHETRDE